MNSLPTAVTTQTTTVNRTTAASIEEGAATASLAPGAQQQAAANLMRASQPAAPLQTTSLRVPTITAPAAAATAVVAEAAGQTGSANQQVLTPIHTLDSFSALLKQYDLGQI